MVGFLIESYSHETFLARCFRAELALLNGHIQWSSVRLPTCCPGGDEHEPSAGTDDLAEVGSPLPPFTDAPQCGATGRRSHRGAIGDDEHRENLSAKQETESVVVHEEQTTVLLVWGSLRGSSRAQEGLSGLGPRTLMDSGFRVVEMLAKAAEVFRESDKNTWALHRF